jgi:membrane protein implicated in regulation of membrane protease activity
VLVLIAILAAIFFLPSPWGLVAVLVALVVDLSEVGFGLWYAKRRKPQTGSEALIGRFAHVVVRCDPLGQVRVEGGELWQARAEEGAEAGEQVRVEAVGADLVLSVRPVASGT